MKVLIIGNGFDIAHGLPTRYSDFLQRVEGFLAFDALDDMYLTEVGGILYKALRHSGMYEDFRRIASGNVWVEYFVRKYKDIGKKENWIDCEQEIYSVISAFEKAHIWSAVIEPDGSRFYSQSLVESFYSFKGISPRKERPFDVLYDPLRISEFVEFLFQQLRDFTRLLEIYIDSFINYILKRFTDRHNKQKQIDELDERVRKGDRAREDLLTLDQIKKDEFIYYSSLPLKKLDFDYVLSFNYTKTYELLYGKASTQYCYIHGKAQADADKTNMILGIRDPLSGGDQDEHFAFSKFKKYFQRIFYRTGSEYRDWVREMQQSATFDEVHIIGHSLDETDHEVLNEFFNINRNSGEDVLPTKITVYFHDKVSNIEKIQKVIRMIGKENLTERVHGKEWDIRFVDQYDETDGIFRDRVVNVKMLFEEK